MDFDSIRSDYSILTIMAKLGCDMTHKGYMYKAPYREDKTPSMHVDVRRNVWCDYGNVRSDGRHLGGGNIELVKMMFGLNSNKEAAEKIVDICGGLREVEFMPKHVTKDLKKDPGIKITSTLNMICSRNLRNYLMQRGIHPDLASRWCNEVDFLAGASGRKMYAIGFMNDKGGYAFRNSFFKGTDISSISTIVKGRSIVGDPREELDSAQFYPDAGKGKALVFEGFMDYLSYLAMKGLTDPDCDCVVLNSTANVGEAVRFLSTHDVIECWLDNDEAGRSCREFIESKCPQSKVEDMSPTYCKCNDLNEYLVLKINQDDLMGRRQGRGIR